MRRVARWALAALVALATGLAAAAVWTFFACAAGRRGDGYLVGIAYFAAAWVALVGLGVIASLLAPTEGV